MSPIIRSIMVTTNDHIEMKEEIGRQDSTMLVAPGQCLMVGAATMEATADVIEMQAVNFASSFSHLDLPIGVASRSMASAGFSHIATTATIAVAIVVVHSEKVSPTDRASEDNRIMEVNNIHTSCVAMVAVGSKTAGFGNIYYLVTIISYRITNLY